jgi:hypothetical protein
LNLAINHDGAKRAFGTEMQFFRWGTAEKRVGLKSFKDQTAEAKDLGPPRGPPRKNTKGFKIYYRKYYSSKRVTYSQPGVT